MKYKKLSSGFLITDLKEPQTSSGLVRLAPKILPNGAEQLARSATYMFALHKMEIAGASAAINSEPAQRKANLASFLSEISPLVSNQSFLPDAGKGLTEDDLSPIRAGDARAEVRLTEMLALKNQSESKSCKLYQYCIGTSAVSAIAELLNNNSSGLEGKNISIEGFNANAYGALKALEDTGANLIGISCGSDFAFVPEGIDISQAAKSWEEHGADFLKQGDLFASELKPAKDIFFTPTDILFVGSKMGAIDHTLAEKMEIAALASLHPIPYTTKALVTLDRKGVIVPPDFLCLGGQAVADWSDLPAENPEAIIKAVSEKTKELAGEMDELGKQKNSEQQNGGQKNDGQKNTSPNLFLAGCKMAEDFLKTWQDDLPFGRALA